MRAVRAVVLAACGVVVACGYHLQGRGVQGTVLPEHVRSIALVPFENHTSFPAPGQVLLYPGGISETEILLAYGGVRFASKVGQLAGNHFLTIVEGTENLLPLGKLTLWQGAQDIVFEPDVQERVRR